MAKERGGKTRIMGFVDEIKCVECKEVKHIVIPPGQSCPKVCKECGNRKVVSAEDQYIAKLKELSLDERLERIERALFRANPLRNFIDIKV